MGSYCLGYRVSISQDENSSVGGGDGCVLHCECPPATELHT